jgi:hypothetical protein
VFCRIIPYFFLDVLSVFVLSFFKDILSSYVLSLYVLSLYVLSLYVLSQYFLALNRLIVIHVDHSSAVYSDLCTDPLYRVSFIASLSLAIGYVF